MDTKILPAEFKYCISGLEMPAMHLFVGMTKAGKSNLLKWILYEYSKKKLWHKIFVFCPTGTLDNKGNYNEFIDKDFIFVDTDRYMSIFDDIYDFQKKHNKRRILCIFDDCIGSVNFSKDFFTKIAISGRHYNISCIIATQYLKKINPVIRTNAATYFVFKTSAENIDCLSDFNNEIKERQIFKSRLFEYISTRYNCVRININSKIEKGLMFFKTLPMDIDFKIINPTIEHVKIN